MNIGLDLPIPDKLLVPRLPAGVVFKFINHEFELIVGLSSVKYEVFLLTYPCIRCVPVFLIETPLNPLTMDRLRVPFDPDLPPPVNDVRYVI